MSVGVAQKEMRSMKRQSKLREPGKTRDTLTERGEESYLTYYDEMSLKRR